MTGTEVTGTVGIVGAGPVGLTLALRLAGFGVPCTILEADPRLIRQGSKACLVQGDALEVLDKIGCARTIADEGVTWTVARTYVRNQEIRAVRFPHGPGFGPFVNISQYRIEQVLAAAAEAEPAIEMRWAHEVVAVTARSGDVGVRVRTPTGDQELRFDHLVACDGVRSTLRELVGVRWTGYTHGDRFLITDIRARLPLAKERHFHYDPVFNPGRQLVMHPQPDDVWRIDWQLPPDADVDAERSDGRFDRRVRDVIGDRPYEVQWVSTYRFHQRVVERLRVGRVLFAGDAAHALPPYGSRGMNSGLQDADNLAWKLALRLSDAADDTLLESYHTERYAAAAENLRITEATIRFMVPPSRLRRWTRAVLLRLSLVLGLARDHVNSGRMTEPHRYVDSPVVQTGHPLLGAFAPDARVTVDGVATRLRERFGSGFVLLIVGDGAAAGRILRDARLPAAPVPVRPVVVLPAGGVPDAVDGGTGPAPVVARAHDEGPREQYGEGWWLVRPDGHLAARGDDGAAVPAALRTALGRLTDRVEGVAAGVDHVREPAGRVGR